MKKFLSLAIIFYLLFCAPVPTALARGSYLGNARVVNCNSWVTLREYASTSAPSVARVPLGATVEAYYFDSQFTECYYNGIHGYILSTYLSNGSNGTQSSSSSSYLGKKYVVNCKEFVTLRKYADTKAPTVTKVAKGQQVDAYYYNGAFCECYYNGLKGYILSQYLGDSPNRDTAPVNPEKTVKPNPTKQDNRYDLNQYEYLPVVEKGRGALVFQKTPRGSFMKKHKFYDGDYVYVNVNWRQNGYAIAYEDGEYGYVDASYIDW